MIRYVAWTDPAFLAFCFCWKLYSILLSISRINPLEVGDVAILLGYIVVDFKGSA